MGAAAAAQVWSNVGLLEALNEFKESKRENDSAHMRADLGEISGALQVLAHLPTSITPFLSPVQFLSCTLSLARSCVRLRLRASVEWWCGGMVLWCVCALQHSVYFNHAAIEKLRSSTDATYVEVISQDRASASRV